MKIIMKLSFITQLLKTKIRLKNLQKKKGIDLEGLEIELERTNVKDQLGRDFNPYIEDALVY